MIALFHSIQFCHVIGFEKISYYIDMPPNYECSFSCIILLLMFDIHTHRSRIELCPYLWIPQKRYSQKKIKSTIEVNTWFFMCSV